MHCRRVAFIEGFDKYKDVKIYRKETENHYTELTMKIENVRIIFECDELNSIF